MNYYYKYKKYKSKYLIQKGAAKDIDYQYDEKLNQYIKRLNSEVITSQLVNEIIDFFKIASIKSYNVEMMHILEDQLSAQFIYNISNRQLTDMAIIIEIATLITQLNETDYLKWYA
jgi:hypothetical protein